MVGIFKLEKEFANYIGTDFGVAVNSGTSALTLALSGLNIGYGDEVILSGYNMGANKFALSYVNADPVYVDCDWLMNIDVYQIEKKITPRTKAVIATHIYGRPCNMSKLLEICEKHKIKLIEDCAEAHGAEYLGKRVGGFGDVSCFSFFQNKIVAGEEGGMCLTNDPKLAERMRWLKCMAFGEGLEKYKHTEVGYNFRMPESQAEIIRKSLKDVEKNLKKRKKIEGWFDEYMPDENKLPPRNVVWVYDFVTDKKELLYRALTAHRIPVRPFFYPLRETEVAKNYYEKGLYIPFEINWKKSYIKLICDLIKQYG